MNEAVRERFTGSEIRFLVGLASSVGLRQIGLLLVIPFISVYSTRLEGGTPALAGLALGVYGLTQALLQVPYGFVSDRVGRKPVLIFGLLVFAAGYLLAGVARDIYVFILARLLQGAGAVSAVVYAWIGDEISASKRNRAMSVLGIIVGTSAVVAFVFGPLLYARLGLKNLFFLTAFITLAAVIYILVAVHENRHVEHHAEGEKVSVKLLTQSKMLAAFYGGFLTNFILISFFYLAPLLLSELMSDSELWKIYVPGALLGIAAMRVNVALADRGMLRIVLSLPFLFASAGALLLLSRSFYGILMATVLVFAGYNTLVTLLPSTITKMVGREIRGSVTGVYNTAQFIGSFVGGGLTGLFYEAGLVYAVLAVALITVSGIIVSKYVKV